MTEDEWLTCADPMPMLDLLRGKASDRKLRLFSVACFRHLTHLLPDERQHRGIEFIEQLAAGATTMDAGRRVVTEVRHALPTANFPTEPIDDPYYTALMLYRELRSSNIAVHAVAAAGGLVDYPAELAWQCNLFRDIFGNPFRPVAFNPAWRTPSVVRLAQTIYDERAFERLPTLADELEKAGCHDADILAHCRQSGAHVRGCWAIDAVLGKE